MPLQAELANYALQFPGIPIAAARIDQGKAEVAYINCEPTTRFEIGSITKVITAILLCEAADSGQCSLDDPLKKHLPQAMRVPGYFGKKITLEHLARQSSGLPRLPRSMYFKGVYSKQPYARWDKKRLIRAISSTILKTPPGSTYAYSNFGLALENVTGKPYNEPPPGCGKWSRPHPVVSPDFVAFAAHLGLYHRLPWRTPSRVGLVDIPLRA